MLVFLTYQLGTAILQQAAEASILWRCNIGDKTYDAGMPFVHTGMSRKALVIGMQNYWGSNTLRTFYQIIGSGPHPQNRHLCKIAFNLSPDGKNWPLKLKQSARKIVYRLVVSVRHQSARLNS
jgi:hypothetical protein